MKHVCEATFLLLALALASCRSASVQDRPDRQTLHQQAVQESLAPIRPGTPDKAPFWNAQAKQFIWAPAFDFKPVAGARAYRFTVKSESGESHAFEAPEPSASLAPIWKGIPAGPTTI